MKTPTGLKHIINTKDIEGNSLEIEIRLDDECKNGHADFAITATAWEKDKPKIDKFYIYGGCAHDEILKVRPDLKIFVDLHLSDSSGAPMYAIENGFYHVKEAQKNPEKTHIVKDHLRLTDEELEEIIKAPDMVYFSYLLHSFGIPARWKKEAEGAIKLLEKMTGETFIDTSIKSNLKTIATDVLKDVEVKISSGFYSPEAIEARNIQKLEEAKQKKINSLIDSYNKEVEKLKTQLDVNLYVLKNGLSVENFIYYHHTKTGVFNWLDYPEKVKEIDFNAFVENLKPSELPEGIKFELKK